MERHYFMKIGAQFMTCFSRFHMKSFFDTILWRITETYTHKCMKKWAIFNKPKLNCLKYMTYLIQSINTNKNTCNILKHISYTLWLSFYFKFCSDGCSVKFLFLIMTKLCFPLQYEFIHPMSVILWEGQHESSSRAELSYFSKTFSS